MCDVRGEHGIRIEHSNHSVPASLLPCSFANRLLPTCTRELGDASRRDGRVNEEQLIASTFRKVHLLLCFLAVLAWTTFLIEPLSKGVTKHHVPVSMSRAERKRSQISAVPARHAHAQRQHSRCAREAPPKIWRRFLMCCQLLPFRSRLCCPLLARLLCPFRVGLVSFLFSFV